MKLIRLFVFITLFVTGVVANEQTQSDKSYLQYFKSEPTHCYVNYDSILKNPTKYKALLSSIDGRTGRTIIDVYEKGLSGAINYNQVPKQFIFKNNDCINENIPTITELENLAKSYKIDTETIKKYNAETSNINQQLKDLENKYLSEDAEFTQVGDKKYLTTASYLLACLTFNETIVDIKKSLELNRIVLKDGYTIYPNNSVTTTETTVETVETGQIIPASSVILTKDEEVTKKYTTIKIDSISEYLSNNVILYIWEFRAKFDKLLLKMKTSLFLLILPFTLGLMGLTKITKKISKINDFDDIAEKGVMSFVLIFMFYFTNGHFTDNNKDDIRLSTFQNTAGLLFQKSIKFADETANIFSTSYINFKRRNAGFLTEKEVKNLIIEEMKNKKELESLEYVVNNCPVQWNTYRLKSFFELADNQSFPNRFQLTKWLQKGGTNAISQFYKTEQEPILTLQICGQVERRVRVLNKEIDKIDKKLKEVANAMKMSEDKKQLFKIAKIQYHTVAEQGFLAIPQVAVTNIVTDNLNMFGAKTNEKSELKEYQKQSSTDDNLDGSNTSGVFESIFPKLAYMMLPGADSIKKVLTIDKIDNIPLLGNFLSRIPFFKEAVNGIGLAITIIMMKNLVIYFPVIALSMASLMIITWYFISVFIYFLISPFLIVYAGSQQQTEVIKSFITRGIALAFKPILIVLSVVVTILAISLIKDLATIIFDKNFNLMIDLVRTESNYGLVLFFLFLQGVLTVGTMVISLFTAFYLVFSGAEMFLSILGFKETGVDIKETVGNSIENRTGKYNTPGA